MRIEINAGGMGKISVLSFEEAVAQSITVTASVIDSFVEIEDDTYALNGGAGDCQDAVDFISSRIQEESERLESELAFHREVEDFISLAFRVDNEVAEAIRKAKNEFYRLNPWATPPEPEEKNWLDHLAEGLKSAAEFIADVAESVIDTIVRGISDFVEANKEFLAGLVKFLGHVVAVVGIVFVAALTITGAPFLLIVGCAGAMAFLQHFMYGTSEQIAEHGGDFGAYDMQSVMNTASVEAMKEMLTTAIGIGVGKFLNNFGGKLLGEFGKTALGQTKFGKSLISITKIDYAKNTLLKRIGKSVLNKTTESVLSGIISRFTVEVTIDVFDGGDFNIGESLSETFKTEEIVKDVAGGVLEGAGGELYKDYLIDYAKKVDVSTPKDKSLFYSGTTEIDGKTIRSRELALEMGEKKIAVPIDFTPGGKLFNDLDLYNTYDKEFADYIWGNILSKNYSKQAFGTVNIIADKVPFNGVFNTIEKVNILEGIDDFRVTDINLVLNKFFTIVH